MLYSSFAIISIIHRSSYNRAGDPHLSPAFFLFNPQVVLKSYFQPVEPLLWQHCKLNTGLYSPVPQVSPIGFPTDGSLKSHVPAWCDHGAISTSCNIDKNCWSKVANIYYRPISILLYHLQIFGSHMSFFGCWMQSRYRWCHQTLPGFIRYPTLRLALLPVIVLLISHLLFLHLFLL